MKAILAICLLIASCAPKAIIVEPIAPAVVRARAEVRAAAVSSERLQESVSKVDSGIHSAAAVISMALKSSERLYAAGIATPAELHDQWRAMVGLQSAVAAVVADSEAATRNATEQAFLRRVSDKSMDALVPVAVKADKQAVESATALAKQADNAALGKAMKWLFWIAIAATIIGGVAMLAVRFLKPI